MTFNKPQKAVPSRVAWTKLSNPVPCGLAADHGRVVLPRQLLVQHQKRFERRALEVDRQAEMVRELNRRRASVACISGRASANALGSFAHWLSIATPTASVSVHDGEALKGRAKPLACRVYP